MKIQDHIRVIEDFPTVGISFKDITPLLKDPTAFRYAVDRLADYGNSRGATVVVGPEARGFAVGAPVAYALGVGFVPVRKQGKLPDRTLSLAYDLEYGHDHVEIHADALAATDRVLIVDDLLATGGTVNAVAQLVERSGAAIAGFGFLIELVALQGRVRIEGYDALSLVRYEY